MITRDLLTVSVAIIGGLAVGIQAVMNGRAGRAMGSIPAGLLIYISGGLIAAGLLVALLSFTNAVDWGAARRAAPFIVTAGACGSVIVTSLAFAVARIGVAAGLSAVLFGQYLVAIIVDTVGWGDIEPVPLRPERLAGLVLLGVATFLLLPNQNG